MRGLNFSLEPTAAALLLAVALRDSLLSRFVGAQSPAAAAQLFRSALAACR